MLPAFAMRPMPRNGLLAGGAKRGLGREVTASETSKAVSTNAERVTFSRPLLEGSPPFCVLQTAWQVLDALAVDVAFDDADRRRRNSALRAYRVGKLAQISYSTTSRSRACRRISHERQRDTLALMSRGHNQASFLQVYLASAWFRTRWYLI